MKYIKINENGIHIVFGITDKNQIKLLHFSKAEFDENDICKFGKECKAEDLVRKELGTGGLVRAYTEAAKLALSDAGIHKMQLMKLVKITTNYNDSGKVQYLLSNSDALIDSTDYTADVCFNVAVPADSYGCLVKQITESTSARALIEDSGEEYR